MNVVAGPGWGAASGPVKPPPPRTFTYLFLFSLLVAGSTAFGQVDTASLKPFLKAMEMIQTRYVDESKISSEQLLAKAEEGVVDALDPESLVLSGEDPPGEAEIGITVGVKDSTVWVLDVAEGSPADQAGLRAGDRLLRINGEPVHAQKRPEIEHALRGKAGSSLWLLWVDAQEDYREVALVRKALTRPAWRHLELDDVGIIQVFRLNAASGKEIQAVLRASEVEGARGAILDLRRSSGGDVDAALSLADACFAGGELLAIGQTANPENTRQYVAAKKSKPLLMPLVILAGGSTQGAAELLAAALKEHRRAVVVGKPTFGFVARQKEFPLGRDGKQRVRLTVERFLSPSTVSLTGTGVGADLSVPSRLNREVSRLLARHRVAERLTARMLESPPAAFSMEAIQRGELKLNSMVAKGKSVAEQRGEFEQAFAIAVQGLLRELEVDVKLGELAAERLALISKVRVLLARSQMKPKEALLVALREDPEIALGVDVLKAMRTLRKPFSGRPG